MADVVIAFNVSDHNHNLLDAELKAFIKAFTGDDSLAFGDDKMRVAVVQSSNDVQVLLPLQKGTSAAEIKSVKIDGENASSENPMKLEEIVPAVRMAAFGPKSGERPTVPKIEVIVAISKKSYRPRFDGWMKQAEQEAFQLAADVVQTVHLSILKTYILRCSGSTVEFYTYTKNGASVLDGFKPMGKDAVNRLKALLESCSYMKLMPCHYEVQECGARVDSVINMLPCQDGAEECKKQGDEMSTWTEFKYGMRMRIPMNVIKSGILGLVTSSLLNGVDASSGAKAEVLYGGFGLLGTGILIIGSVLLCGWFRKKKNGKKHDVEEGINGSTAKQQKSNTGGNLAKPKKSTADGKLAKGKESVDGKLAKGKESIDGKLAKGKESVDGNLAKGKESIDGKLAKGKESVDGNLAKTVSSGKKSLESKLVGAPVETSILSAETPPSLTETTPSQLVRQMLKESKDSMEKAPVKMPKQPVKKEVKVEPKKPKSATKSKQELTFFNAFGK